MSTTLYSIKFFFFVGWFCNIAITVFVILSIETIISSEVFSSTMLNSPLSVLFITTIFSPSNFLYPIAFSNSFIFITISPFPGIFVTSILPFSSVYALTSNFSPYIEFILIF